MVFSGTSSRKVFNVVFPTSAHWVQHIKERRGSQSHTVTLYLKYSDQSHSCIHIKEGYTTCVNYGSYRMSHIIWLEKQNLFQTSIALQN